MSSIGLVLACLAGFQPGGAAGEVRLDVTRDTWVSEVGQEADGNNGAAPRLKLKSIQEMTLIDVDAAAPRDVYTAATLHLKLAGTHRPKG